MGGLETPKGYPRGYIGYRDKGIFVKENKLVEGKDIRITTHYILVHSYCHRNKMEQAELGDMDPLLLATVETTPPMTSSAEESMLHETFTSAVGNTVTTPTISPRRPVASKDLAKLADSGAGILSDVSESEFSLSDEEVGNIAFEHSNDELMWPTNPPLPKAVVESSPAGLQPTPHSSPDADCLDLGVLFGKDFKEMVSSEPSADQTSTLKFDSLDPRPGDNYHFTFGNFDKPLDSAAARQLSDPGLYLDRNLEDDRRIQTPYCVESSPVSSPEKSPEPHNSAPALIVEQSPAASSSAGDGSPGAGSAVSHPSGAIPKAKPPSPIKTKRTRIRCSLCHGRSHLRNNCPDRPLELIDEIGSPRSVDSGVDAHSVFSDKTSPSPTPPAIPALMSLKLPPILLNPFVAKSLLPSNAQRGSKRGYRSGSRRPAERSGNPRAYEPKCRDFDCLWRDPRYPGPGPNDLAPCRDPKCKLRRH